MIRPLVNRMNAGRIRHRDGVDKALVSRPSQVYPLAKSLSPLLPTVVGPMTLAWDNPTLKTNRANIAPFSSNFIETAFINQHLMKRSACP